MKPEEIIASGKLEMYACGALPEVEALEIQEAIAAFPEVKRELELIEESLLRLAETVAPPLHETIWKNIINTIKKTNVSKDAKVHHLNWPAVTGWAAAILFLGGIMWLFNQNDGLNDSLRIISTKNIILKEEKTTVENRLVETEQILEIVRSKEFQAYNLPGNQAVAPAAFAKVYINKKDNIAYIDTKGLPPPPRGKVYQVWSLKMEPLTPSSVGLISEENKAGDGIYRFINFPDPEAFGITLEPEGGSQTPTLSQLFILGAVSI